MGNFRIAPIRRVSDVCIFTCSDALWFSKILVFGNRCKLLQTSLMGYALCRLPPAIAHCQHFSWDALLSRKLAFSGLQGPFFMILGGLGTNFHVNLDFLGTQNCFLACLVASLWRPRRPWGDPYTLGSTREDTLRSSL